MSKIMCVSKTLLAVAFCAALFASLLSTHALAAGRPNIVLIMVDDFGYECVGANGGTSYRTPQLDKLAAGGMRFERCYVQPLCTPTRVQLMTGQYNVRNYTHFGHLEPSQTTFAQLFQKAGYATAITGKWQLGRDVSLPAHFGFGSYCLWQLNRRPPRYANPGLEIDGREVDYSHGEYGPDIVNQYARDFIAAHRQAPFLLYYPMILTHSPFQPTPDSKDWNPMAIGEKVNDHARHFADNVAYADKLIGKLIAALDEHNLRENTLVLIVGDNGTYLGHPSQMGQRTVRGGKGLSKDSGMRVPLIANWPGVVPAGRVSTDLVDSTDFLPTMCAAAGVEIPDGLIIDGHSFLPQLRGEKGTPRQWIYSWYARNGGPTAEHEFAMNERYKLYRTGQMFDVAGDLDEQRPLDSATLTGDAALAHKLLGGALARYQDVRPEAIVRQAAPRQNAKAKREAE